MIQTFEVVPDHSLRRYQHSGIQILHAWHHICISVRSLKSWLPSDRSSYQHFNWLSHNGRLPLTSMRFYWWATYYFDIACLLIIFFKLFKGATELFSQAQVPLIVDIIPMLEKIREGMIGACDDAVNVVPNVIRVACQAGIFLIDKYSTFTSECPVYLISIGTWPLHIHIQLALFY